LGFIYASVVDVDPVTTEIRPRLARWTVRPDGRTVDLEFENAAWSDGTPITAGDWLLTVKAVARRAAPGAYLVNKADLSEIEGFSEYAAGTTRAISGIQTDGRHLTVRLRRSLCNAIGKVFRQTRPLPSHVFGKYIADDDPRMNLDSAPENTAPPVSSGPFVLGEWRRGDEIVLKANQRFWKGAPLVDEYVFRSVESEQLTESIRNGTTSYVTTGVRKDDVAALERQSTLTVMRVPSSDHTYLGWNLRTGAAALADKRIRQALAYGLDLDLFIRSSLGGLATRLGSAYLPGGWVSLSGLRDYAYDPGTAEKLIEAAGYRRGASGIYEMNGAPLVLRIATNSPNPTRMALLQFAVDGYRRIGVSVTPVVMPFEDLVRKLDADGAGIDGWILSWGYGIDPDRFDVWHSSNIPERRTSGQALQNWSGFQSKAVDEALERGRNGPDCSVATRGELYSTIARIMNEEQPYNFGFVAMDVLVASKRLHYVTPSWQNVYPDIETWWLAPEKK
jgi:peptide/nickel transport system substrate-binding protein